jgi:hypothetical protein
LINNLAVGSGTLTVDCCTLTVSSDTSTIDDTFAVGGYTLMSASSGTLTSAGGTRTVDDITLMRAGDTRMVDDQHRLSSAIANMTR